MLLFKGYVYLNKLHNSIYILKNVSKTHHADKSQETMELASIDVRKEPKESEEACISKMKFKCIMK